MLIDIGHDEDYTKGRYAHLQALTGLFSRALQNVMIVIAISAVLFYSVWVIAHHPENFETIAIFVWHYIGPPIIYGIRVFCWGFDWAPILTLVILLVLFIALLIAPFCSCVFLLAVICWFFVLHDSPVTAWNALVEIL